MQYTQYWGFKKTLPEKNNFNDIKTSPTIPKTQGTFLGSRFQKKFV